MRRSYFAPKTPTLSETGYYLARIVSFVLVEAPGTAPGSALLILQYVYRHSQPKLTSKSIAGMRII